MDRKIRQRNSASVIWKRYFLAPWEVKITGQSETFVYDNGAKVTNFAENNYCFVCNAASFFSCFTVFPDFAAVETEEETSFSFFDNFFGRVSREVWCRQKLFVSYSNLRGKKAARKLARITLLHTRLPTLTDGSQQLSGQYPTCF